MFEILNSSSSALVSLFFLSFIYFLENFERYFISVSPIPYIDYNSYEYSVLAGPAFTIIYTFGGLLFALSYYDGDILEKGKKLSKYAILAIAMLIFSVSFLS